MDSVKIILITGVTAAGKSTIAQSLAETIHPSIHLRGDVFRRMVVNGREEMSREPTPEALRQLRLRYEAAFQVARLYRKSGFNVIYQDVIVGPVLTEVVELYRNLPLHVFVLSPRSEVVATREQNREKTGSSTITVGQLHSVLQTTEKVGVWIDSSEQTVDETTQTVLNLMNDARIRWS